MPIPSSSSHIRAPALAETPPAAATVPLFSSDSDEAAPRDPYFESNLARSDSLTVMASLTAQLSDAIAKVGSGNEMDGSDAATPSTRRPTRTDALAAEDVGKRLSDAPSDDSYHDAQMASTTASPQLPPLPVDISPAGSRPTSPSASSRMDAKARAAAFVADLKRARAAAGISTTASSPTNGSSSSLAFASPTLSLPTSPLVPRDSPSSAVEAFHTPYQPSDSPNAPSLPPLNHSTSFVWDISTPHSASVSTHTTPELVQPEASPPPPPPRTTFERRISEGELPALPKSPALPSALPALPASPASPAVAAMSAIRLDKLHRRRPLPACLSIAPELKKARTPGDRAAIYAKKVNQLRKETSGLSDWIGAMGGPTGASGRTGEQVLTRHSASSAIANPLPLLSHSAGAHLARPQPSRARRL